MPEQKPKIAYFSMEFALRPEIPNFAGGLGVLATDIMKSCADIEIPAVGVSLIYHLSDKKDQGFDPSKFFKKRKETVKVQIEDRDILIGAWEYEIEGINGNKVPIFFLTTYDPENEKWDRDLTKNLYPSNQYTRLAQEVILGIGGLRILRKLGYNDIDYFHLNEGHTAFVTLERLKEESYNEDKVRSTCRFTTHTPIPAGHDHFEYRLAKQVLGVMLPWNIKDIVEDKYLHMTKLALKLSGKSNAVSQRHREVCEKMFPDTDFVGITNGVHHRRWIKGEMKELFNKYLPGWQEDPYKLGKSSVIEDGDLRKAHLSNKKLLIDYINKKPEYFPFKKGDMKEDDYFDENTLTITFSRRFVPYKRPLLLFSDLEKIREIGYKKLQIIYSGHCYPNDEFCNNVMKELRSYEKALRGQVKLAVMPDRNLDTSALLIAGSDIWLNNPEPPMEASGTSGMKAAMNGVLNLSTPDGWWLEAKDINPESGWAFGADIAGHDEIDAKELYEKLEEIVDCYYNKRDIWTDKMKHAIALGARFNTHACTQEYLEKMWSN